jgi:type III restriction enzyme
MERSNGIIHHGAKAHEGSMYSLTPSLRMGLKKNNTKRTLAQHQHYYMSIKVLKYQHEAIDSLLGVVNKFLKKEETKNVVLQAPTGSGKTIMMAEFLDRFATESKDDKSFSFIWAAPRKLHNQSKEKLENYFKDSRVLECLNIEDLSETKIGENEILFLNWESINKRDNVFVNDNERDFNLTSMISNTMEEGREIILIVDESHHTSKAPNTGGLIEIMKPRITIEVSATPPKTQSDYTEKVEFKDVVQAGMIKKEVSINPNLKEDKLEGEGSDEFILREALKKREELKKEFEKLGKKINPLLLIQLPDKGKFDKEDTRKEKMIEELLAKKFNITTHNGKLGVYLSEDKRNLENITKNESDEEVLLFKQAIALGWDCPRAYILVLFREWHSEVFKIQTVGRIMRMPELLHYKIEALNKGYLYTNIANTHLKMEEDIAKEYFTIYTAQRKHGDNLNLKSYHIKRDRGETRLDATFFKIFETECKKYKLKNKLTLKVTKSIDHIPVDGTLHVENYGTVNDPVETLKNISLARNTLELELALKYMIDNTLREGGLLFPESRSIERVFKCIYNFFLDELKMDYEEKEKEIIAIVLDNKNENLQHFKNIINLSLREYVDAHPPKKNEAIENEALWNIPEVVELNANHKERKPKVKKSAMVPFYESTSQARHWETENKFIEFLEASNKVEWWFKNGERDGTYFAIPYKDSANENQAFYVDFIVRLKDGRLGLFDTKSGWTAEAQKAGPKSAGLQKYISEHKDKKLFGSIVVPKGNSFWINTQSPYKYDTDLKGWEVLEW